jgi:DNA-binding beta-propeller fold protein YncE
MSEFRGVALRAGLRSVILISALAAGLSSVAAQVVFDAPDADYAGRVRASAAERGKPVLAGSEVQITGQNFKPGQQITITRGTAPVLGAPVVADGEGKFEAKFTLPADAVVGTHPLVVSTAKPYHAEIVDLKISPEIPLSGSEKFTTVTAKLVPGLYQSAYSSRNNVLFVTASSGRPPAQKSALLKVDPETLAIVAEATPPTAPAREGAEEGGAGVFSVYGLGVDEANDTVWVTNTRQNTVAAYKQSDLSLIKQFDPGTVQHARDIAVDEKNGKVFASATGTPKVAVFDAKSLEFVKYIEIKSTKRGDDFSVGSLRFDPTSGKLYTVSLSTSEAAIIDAATLAVDKVFPVEGARTTIGVSYDPQTNRILVAGQGSDNLLIVDAATGKTLHNVAVGAGALNVAFDPVKRLAYVASRDAGTVTAVDLDGNIVANLENAPFSNHVSVDGKGDVFAVNKARNPEDEQGDRITRIAPRP